MHLVYSAFNTTNTHVLKSAPLPHDQPANELLLRYQAYETACNKYSREIVAIQKYLPGWAPQFR
ncbi:MAG TPA: hypothetical protein VIM16_20180 [Mucilaginibacter sp.]|jgi:hypothetical protein